MSALAWAKRSHEAVMARAALPAASPERSRFRTHAMNAPVLLRQAGAAQAMAFWRRNADGRKFSDALAHVFGALPGGPAAAEPSGAALLAWLVGLEQARYTSASRDLVQAATWLRRFAQSELGT